jgi:hypothetical protein
MPLLVTSIEPPHLLRAPRGPPDPEALANSILPGTSPFVILCLGNMIENIREPSRRHLARLLRNNSLLQRLCLCNLCRD